ncbi:glycosyltransferase, partial [Anaerotruncus sp. X29]|nr:glycosyltransferase [Anaerotruncus sp. X29]
MKRKPLISIVVPIYNVEEYIHECIESLLAQTYTNLDI